MMKQPVPKMIMLRGACTICDLWMRRGLIPRSHAGIKGFLMSFIRLMDRMTFCHTEKKQDHLMMNVATDQTIILGHLRP